MLKILIPKQNSYQKSKLRKYWIKNSSFFNPQIAGH